MAHASGVGGRGNSNADSTLISLPCGHGLRAISSIAESLHGEPSTANRIFIRLSSHHFGRPRKMLFPVSMLLVVHQLYQLRAHSFGAVFGKSRRKTPQAPLGGAE